MATDTVAKEFYESSKLAKYPFEPYWPAGKLRICVTGALDCRSPACMPQAGPMILYSASMATTTANLARCIAGAGGFIASHLAKRCDPCADLYAAVSLHA